jgi:hypothetical protein
MIVYSIVAITLLIAITSLLLLKKGSKRQLNQGWHLILLSLAIAIFIYLYGAWVYLSIYLKYAFGIVYLLAATTGFVKRKNEKRASIAGIFFSVVFALIFGVCGVLYFTGSTGKPDTVALTFPLKTGKYFILQGGKGLPANFFHYSYRGAIYAIDIVKLNEYGNRARKVFSSRLEDYYIFNDTVFSPCDGVIQRVRDENPDNIPPSRERGPSNTNQVLIETDSFYIFMAHLRQRGVFVKEGERVKTGQPLALVGNSGFTLEPHLHIQAHAKSGHGDGWYHEKPLYIEFDGRGYLLFEVIRPKRVDMVDR